MTQPGKEIGWYFFSPKSGFAKAWSSRTFSLVAFHTLIERFFLIINSWGRWIIWRMTIQMSPGNMPMYVGSRLEISFFSREARVNWFQMKIALRNDFDQITLSNFKSKTNSSLRFRRQKFYLNHWDLYNHEQHAQTALKLCFLHNKLN